MSGQHTPGPWEASRECPSGQLHVRTVDRRGGWICGQIANGHDVAVAEYEANARLIAAAPDLLLSLAWLLDIEGRTDRETVTEERPLALAAARKAIAAIKGGAQ